MVLGATCSLGWGASEFGYIPRGYIAEVVKVIDGDTLTLRALIPEWNLTTVHRVGLLGVDTTEMTPMTLRQINSDLELGVQCSAYKPPKLRYYGAMARAMSLHTLSQRDKGGSNSYYYLPRDL